MVYNLNTMNEFFKKFNCKINENTKSEEFFKDFAFFLIHKFDLLRITLLKMDKKEDGKKLTTIGLSLFKDSQELCLLPEKIATEQKILGNPVSAELKEIKTFFVESLESLFCNSSIKGSSLAVLFPYKKYDIYFIFTKEEEKGKITREEIDDIEKYVGFIYPILLRSYEYESPELNEKRRDFRTKLIDQARGTPPEVLEVIVKLFEELLGGKLAKIWLFNELTNEFVLSSISKDSYPIKYTKMKANSIFGECVFKDNVKIINKDDINKIDDNSSNEKQLYIELLNKTEADVIICIPLLYKPVGVTTSDKQKFGFVDVFLTKNNIFLQANDHLLWMAHQSASTIQESFLFEKIKILDEFNMLIGKKLGEYPEITIEKRKNNFLNEIINLIKCYLKINAVSIFETADNEQEIFCIITTGIEGNPPLWKVKYKKNEGATGIVFATGKSIITRAVEKDERFKHRFKEKQKCTDNSNPFIAVPIKAGNKIIGVIRCVEKHGIFGAIETFSQRDLENLQFISDQLSPVLQMLNVQQKIQQGLTIAVHDLKALLGAIHDASDILRRKLPEAIEKEIYEREIKYPIEDIYHTTSFISTLIKQVGITVGVPFEPKYKKTNIEGEIIARLKAMLYPLANQKKIRLCYDGFKQPQTINIDPNLIEQSLFNLIVNAIKYSFKDVDVMILGNYYEQKRQFSITIKNWGPGVEEYERELIFLPFFRGKAAETSSAGLGLGLYIVKQIIESHNGKVFVGNLKNPTDFVIELPV